MLSAQPVFQFSYLKKEKTVLAPNMGSQLYLSWEDALWDILRSFSIKPKSTILVPSFFCEDVMDNMRTHGLIPEYYEVDRNLQPAKQDILNKINTFHPSIIVLFHAVGISNKLVSKEFIGNLANDIFVIEDCVHRIVNPAEIEVYSEKHVIINSFRKVVPLQGSFLFGKQPIINSLKGPENTYFYSGTVILFWLLMQFCLLSQTVLNIFGFLAERFMLNGYDVIGDEQKPGFSPPIFAELYMKLDFRKIKNTKQKQITLYQSKIMSHSLYYVPFFQSEESGELRGYPIVMSKEFGKNIILYLRKKGIYIRAELENSDWTKKRSIMYLPLGLHLKNKDINYISLVFNQAIST